MLSLRLDILQAWHGFSPERSVAVSQENIKDMLSQKYYLMQPIPQVRLLISFPVIAMALSKSGFSVANRFVLQQIRGLSSVTKDLKQQNVNKAK